MGDSFAIILELSSYNSMYELVRAKITFHWRIDGALVMSDSYWIVGVLNFCTLFHKT